MKNSVCVIWYSIEFKKVFSAYFVGMSNWKISSNKLFCAGNKLPLTKTIEVWQYERKGDFIFTKINDTEVDYVRKVL